MAQRLGPLSRSAVQVLNWMDQGLGTHHNCNGMSEHGGRARILSALRNRDYIDHDYKITEAGKRFLATKQGRVR